MSQAHWCVPGFSVPVIEVECPFCDKSFFEIDGCHLEDCPHCQRPFQDARPNVCNHHPISVSIDTKTGQVWVNNEKKHGG